MFKKLIEDWKNKRAIVRRKKEVRKAQLYLYNHVMRKQYLVKEIPSYKFQNLDPERYWTRVWYNPNTKIKMIRADFIEVFYEDNLVANWIDREQYNLGLADIACTDAFTYELVKDYAKI